MPLMFKPMETTMSYETDLEELSEGELTTLIDDATRRRDLLKQTREREDFTASDGSKGQDVRNPNHGVITAPTPREVKEEGPAHGAK